jgi:glycerol kinase
MGAEIPIAGIAGDQQAALAGQACFRAGLSKNTYGTGCFALLHAGDSAPVSANRLLATRAASTTGAAHFAVEGSVFVAGAAIQWLRDQLKLIATAGESEAAAESVSGSDGVYLVPAFAGLGAPYWDGTARGSLTGLTRGTTGAHIVRAALESIAYQTRDLVEAMEADSGAELTELRVDGGATANNFLMQFQADILGKPIVRPWAPRIWRVWRLVSGKAKKKSRASGASSARSPHASASGNARIFTKAGRTPCRER